MLKRKNFISENGERFTLLLNEHDLPDFWTTLFLTTLGRVQSSATTRKYVDNLVHLNLFEIKLGERLEERIISLIQNKESREKILEMGMFFSISEIQLLINHCGTTTKETRSSLLAKSKSKLSNVNITHLINRYSKAPVPIAEQKKRIKLVLNYFEFVAYTLLSKKAGFSEYKSLIASTINYIHDQTHHLHARSVKIIDPEKKAPPPQVFQLAMEMVQPKNPNNPYTSEVQLRNFVMLSILYETGMRSGELLQLKIPDIDFESKIIRIRRRHDDIEDRYRAIEPNAKTLERDLPISEKLCVALRNYILKERSQLLLARKHPFIFVSHKGTSTGKLISVIQLCKMVDKINDSQYFLESLQGKKLKETKKITRHGFRHNFNNNLSKTIDAVNKKARNEGNLDDLISEKKEIEQRMYLNGHKSYKSAEVYTLRHTKESAEKLMKLKALLN